MEIRPGGYKKIKIKEIKEEIEGFKSFVFENGHGILYKPGQYITLVRAGRGEEIRRSYSIISSPALDEPLTIGVKRIDNGVFSRYLVDRAMEGDELLTTGSGGLFTLPENIQAYKQLFFYAAGSGITPILSLLKTALTLHPHLTCVLIYSNSSADRSLFLHQLQQMQDRFSARFHLELLYSNSPYLLRARLRRDLIFHFLGRYMHEPKEETLFYICGPESYMRLCTFTLQEGGISPNQIKKENFIFHTAPKASAVPPDKETHTVTIHIGGIHHQVNVSYPDTILKSARKQGIVLPYSCEVGRCANCVARCTKGKIWHSYNEVLTDDDLAKGLVLTCVGYPIQGDADLEIY